MTRTRRHRPQGLLARRWRTLATAAVLAVLSGAVILVWLRIDAEATRTQQVAAEADRRGDAVSTLAGDVRVLRAQIKSRGGTPKAPDPAQAVEGLPHRVEVPVPIPGPQGEPGKPGASGQDGAVGAPGTTGQAGSPGATVTGPSGPAGAQGEKGDPGAKGDPGEKGATGERGPAGASCPEGYSWQPPAGDPDALVCRRDGASAPVQPDPGPTPSTSLLGLAPDRRRY